MFCDSVELWLYTSVMTCTCFDTIGLAAEGHPTSKKRRYICVGDLTGAVHILKSYSYQRLHYLLLQHAG